MVEGNLTIKIVAHRKLWLRSSNKELHEQWLKAFTMERVLSQGVLAPSLTVESLTSDEVQQPKALDPLMALKLKHLTRSHLTKQESTELPSATLFMDSSPQASRAASPAPLPQNDDEEVVVTLEQAFLDPFILGLYEKFAKECFEAENITYILEVRKFEDMMDLASVVWRPDNEALIQAKAQEIYSNFIREGSELELNIIHTIRQKLRAVFEPKMNANEDVPLSRNMFQAVTTEILRLMKTNSWIRFRGSEDWAKVVDHVLEEGDLAHMGPAIPPFAGEFDSQQSFFGSCRRLGQHPVCFMSPVWSYDQWIKESSSDFFRWRGEKTQKLDDLVKAHTATFDGCVTLLKGAKLVLVDPKDSSSETQIGFSYPGFVSEVVEVGLISVVSVWQLIADASDLSFQSHDWNAALASPSVGKLFMQTSPDVSALYDKGPAGVKEAKALMSTAQKEVLHNVCLAEFIHSRGGPQILAPDDTARCDLKWASLLESRREVNRAHLEEWEDLVYELKPKWFFMNEMIRENDPYHNVLLGPSDFVLCFVVVLNLRLASAINLKSYLAIWLADHKKKAGVSRYQAAVELMEAVTQEERELVRVLVQLPSFGTLTGTAVLHAFPLDVYTPVSAPPTITRSRTQTTGTLKDLKDKDRGSAGRSFAIKKPEETTTSPPTSPFGPSPTASPSIRSTRIPKPPQTTYPTNNAAPPSVVPVMSSVSRPSSLFAFVPSIKSLMALHSIPATSTVLKSQVAADAAAAAIKRQKTHRAPEMLEDLTRTPPAPQRDEQVVVSPRPPTETEVCNKVQREFEQVTPRPRTETEVCRASPSPATRNLSGAMPRQPPPPVPNKPPKPGTPLPPPAPPPSATSPSVAELSSTEPLPRSEYDTPRGRARSLKTPNKAAPTRRNTKEAAALPIPETIDEIRAPKEERRSDEPRRPPARQAPPLPHAAERGNPPNVLDSRQTPKAPTKQPPPAPLRPGSPGPSGPNRR